MMNSKIKIILLIILGCTLVFTACRKDYGDIVKPISLTITTKYELDLLQDQVPDSATIKLVNQRNGKVLTFIADSKTGQINIPSLSAGKYIVEASMKMSKVRFEELAGTIEDADEIFFNGFLNVVLRENEENLEISLVKGRTGDWVIKQIYYAGSNQWDGAGFRDQFIEFYNNSDKVLYADSLYFAQIFGENNANPNQSSGWYLSNGQLDWRQPTGMANANSDYVYAYHLFMLPGTGQQYPVQPGESIVLAQNALNHKAPYIGNNGVVQSINKPDLTVDLSIADFEAYLVDYNREYRGKTSAYRWDIDNPSVPNIDVLLNTHNDLILDNKGRDAYVIFNASREFVNDLIKNRSYRSPKQTTANTNDRFIQIPVDIVIDGVELQPTIASNRIAKRLPASIDGGYIFVPKGEYTSQSVIRKTEKIINGRRVLKDTNKSGDDFIVADRPLPKGFID